MLFWQYHYYFEGSFITFVTLIWLSVLLYAWLALTVLYDLDHKHFGFIKQIQNTSSWCSFAFLITCFVWSLSISESEKVHTVLQKSPYKWTLTILFLAHNLDYFFLFWNWKSPIGGILHEYFSHIVWFSTKSKKGPNWLTFTCIFGYRDLQFIQKSPYPCFIQTLKIFGAVCHY